ncbi:MAG: hypothetical protein KAI26_08345 [Nanoarchaeota archaeon]|nr:hypothetical protein [Nanoarchaeota archaeon]
MKRQMALFEKKKKTPLQAPAEAPDASSLPVDQIKAMQARGYANNQIIQALQRDGYTSQQVFDAIKQAELSAAVGAPLQEEGAQPGMVGAEYNEMPPAEGEAYPPEETYPEAPAMPQPVREDMPPPMGAPLGRPGTVDSERIEEIAEAIIDEKWEEIAKNINKIIEWKDTIEAKIQGLDEDFKRLKLDFDKLHTSILGKVGEYDQHILNVGTEIKAMEKVFQKILPTLTENVSQLSRVTERMKKE